MAGNEDGIFGPRNTEVWPIQDFSGAASSEDEEFGRCMTDDEIHEQARKNAMDFYRDKWTSRFTAIAMGSVVGAVVIVVLGVAIAIFRKFTGL